MQYYISDVVQVKDERGRVIGTFSDKECAQSWINRNNLETPIITWFKKNPPPRDLNGVYTWLKNNKQSLQGLLNKVEDL